ncbi:MAG: hypothetical protein HOK21_00810 [Rhodospirillaceae bacterium]|jgi:hypothetical protein|nr:hypothetical protein [Rhodospirillaceae bacterium]MBT4042842.1 hypothetical protein [Rhodospirillaceae bacterium]MBT4689840.1 hypothetical protein [Rhodospirillaceae bacterium]MBT5083724.1 hypothetical protein [Rhodospirillaceae bacterium]MBT5522600.1 hypothetical protein [Rhodospirillaceae bacterium]
MELNLSPSSAQANDKIRSNDVKVSRPVEVAEKAGGEKASAEAEFSAAKSAVGSGEEEQPRKSAVDSDTGHNIDVSV